MKKIITILGIVVVIAVVLYFVLPKETPEETVVSNTEQGETFKPDPSNATFSFDEDSVTLSSGKNETPVAPGSAIVEETILMDKFAYGDLNADGREDTALLLAQYGGGSGTFIYVAVYVSGPVNYKGSEAIFLGDRIAPQNISINNGVVTVVYLDRKADEPLVAEPTVKVTKKFSLMNGKLVER